MVRFLLVRFSSIGDIVLTTPVIRCLKQQVEDAEIHFLVKRQFYPVLKANPYIDKIHQYDNNYWKIISELKKENIHYIIDLHHNLRTFRLKSNLRILSFSFKKLNFKKWLLVNLKINKLPDIHIVDRYFGTVKLFDVVNDDKGLDYHIPSEEEIDISDLPDEYQNGFIIIVIGAKHFTKQIPNDKLVELCDHIDNPVMLMGGSEDFRKAEEVRKNCSKKVINACGKYSINQSASLIRQSELVITPDTGLMHIAAAFGKRIISLWGNTIPKFGMFPYKADHDSRIFQIENLSCRPCTKIGFKKCPQKHFRCMNDIDIREVIRYTNELLKRTEDKHHKK
ncbi:MAG: glycosyltransferase family 9 protein [Bacteroidales bacterium]|nr:glycosyltransferase family 9 protein [Bacteroidales bacterium]